MNPFSGIWRNAPPVKERSEFFFFSGLSDTVRVVYDTRAVPHIFARNDADLFFAQGFVTARDRLWQMEFQALAAAGRLSEVVGPSALDHDVGKRRQGMPQAASGALEVMRRDPETMTVLNSFSAGVNAYIASLTPSTRPLEYKLLDYRPEDWSPLKTVLLIKHMQWTLSTDVDEVRRTNTLAKFGPGFMEKYFPRYPSPFAPVVPAADSIVEPLQVNSPTKPFRPGLVGPIAGSWPVEGNGSNAFAVAGAKTRTGRPFLANDPHLTLALPSLWYEVQLVSPTLNVYGVSLAGAPAVLIGFNRSLAWGLTNGQSDVFDWYQIRFKDSTLSEYFHGGEWKPTTAVVESVFVRRGKPTADTVVFTHHGPIVQKSSERPRYGPAPDHAMRWLGHDPSDEMKAILTLNRARDWGEALEALELFQCPAQNFLVIDSAGNIGVRHQGNFPLRWNGQGRYISDGSDTLYEWQAWIPPHHLPTALNPAAGFLVSANQNPVDSAYPYYLGWGFDEAERATRLGEKLADTSITWGWDEMAGLLQDDYSLHASHLLPEMLRRLDTLGLSENDRLMSRELAAWDFRYRAESVAASLFDQWWRRMFRAIWADEYGSDSSRYQYPTRSRTRKMIFEDPHASWFDDIHTPETESLDDLIRKTFIETGRDMFRRFGRMGEAWNWGAYRPVEIRHLARIPGLGSGKLPADGCAECVNKMQTHHGPTWRMVVTLGDKPRALGIYPGGQSGHPGSPHYLDFLQTWKQGEMHELLFWSGPEEIDFDKIRYSLEMSRKVEKE